MSTAGPGLRLAGHLQEEYFLEAKRRLSAGEFATLHDAQLAIAREHGLPSWAALKEYISAGTGGSPVLAQVRWVISRFGEAGTPGWMIPGDDELHEHFDDHFLRLCPRRARRGRPRRLRHP